MEYNCSKYYIYLIFTFVVTPFDILRSIQSYFWYKCQIQYKYKMYILTNLMLLLKLFLKIFLNCSSCQYLFVTDPYNKIILTLFTLFTRVILVLNGNIPEMTLLLHRLKWKEIYMYIVCILYSRVEISSIYEVLILHRKSVESVEFSVSV